MRLDVAILAAIMTMCFVRTASYAQPPNYDTGFPCEEEWCKKAKYNYKLCNPTTGARINLCTDDPNNQPLLKPLKKVLPFCFFYDVETCRWSKLGFIINDPLNHNERDTIAYFDRDSSTAWVQRAGNRWNSICPPEPANQEYQSCCLIIFWSSDPRNFADPSNDAANTHLESTTSADPRHCVQDCAKSFLAINQTVDFTGVYSFDTTQPRNFFYTDETKKEYIPRDHQRYWYFYSMILHEMGHYLGFNHDDAEDSFGNSCGGHSFSIMESGGGWGDMEQRYLTQDDLCRFKKLYCCKSSRDLSGVDDQPATGNGSSREAMYLDVLPNPSSNNVVRMHLSGPTNTDAKLRILDAGGRTLLERSLDPGLQDIQVETVGWPAGMYLFEVIQQGTTAGAKVILSR